LSVEFVEEFLVGFAAERPPVFFAGFDFAPLDSARFFDMYAASPAFSFFFGPDFFLLAIVLRVEVDGSEGATVCGVELVLSRVEFRSCCVESCSARALRFDFVCAFDCRLEFGFLCAAFLEGFIGSGG